MNTQIEQPEQSTITIMPAPLGGPLLEAVIGLGDSNSKYLGHFPRSAFAREAAKNRILVAVDADGSLAGYILYWVARHRAKIQHCCVDASFRNLGIGRRLVAEVKERTRSLLGIELHCAREFKESCRFWLSNGFVPVGEKTGRGFRARPLTLFAFDHGNSDLFTSQLDAQIEDRRLVVVDTNIAFDWLDQRRHTSPESLALLADWLASEIDLRITDHAFTDANGHPDVQERQRSMAFLRGLGKINEDWNVSDGVRDGLLNLFGTAPSETLQRDVAHMAAAISARADAFVTNDAELLAMAEIIKRDYGLAVCSPGVLIGRLNEDVRSQAYEPVRLGGTPVVNRRLRADELAVSTKRFLDYCGGERKANLEAQVRALLAEPCACEVRVIEWPTGTPVGLVGWDRRVEGCLSIPIVRFLSSKVTKVLARHLVAMFIKTGLSESRTMVTIRDAHLWTDLGAELATFGFVNSGATWARRVAVGCMARESLLACINETKGYAALGQLPLSDSELERVFWPVKIVGVGIRTFIVPIRPEWAIHLFDEELASHRLYGGDPSLMLNTENVYYRSAQHRTICCPGRILWYVSDDGGYDCAGEIRACSSILDVEIGPAKRLFGKNHRLGVYEWPQILQTAGNNPQEDIMAIRFGATELFKRPIARKTIEQILRARGKPMPPISTVYEVTEDCFEEIYRHGQRL